MLKFIKDDCVKIIDPESSLIPVLKEQGWLVEGEKSLEDELEALKAEADALGVKYHHKSGVEKLSALIAQAKEAE